MNEEKILPTRHKKLHSAKPLIISIRTNNYLYENPLIQIYLWSCFSHVQAFFLSSFTDNNGIWEIKQHRDTSYTTAYTIITAGIPVRQPHSYRLQYMHVSELLQYYRYLIHIKSPSKIYENCNKPSIKYNRSFAKHIAKCMASSFSVHECHWTTFVLRITK